MNLSDDQKKRKMAKYLSVRKLYADSNGERTTRDLARFFHQSPQWVYAVIAGKGIKQLEGFENLVHKGSAKK